MMGHAYGWSEWRQAHRSAMLRRTWADRFAWLVLAVTLAAVCVLPTIGDRF